MDSRSICVSVSHIYYTFFFNDTATTEIYTLSLHDALPISEVLYQRLNELRPQRGLPNRLECQSALSTQHSGLLIKARSEEHTSELQSRQYLVCRLLLEKKNKKHYTPPYSSYTT